MCGPLTVADYMKEIFMNPKMGYYMTKDVFGKDGDFTTSPEISQLFGEMIAIWCINEWHKLGSPNPHFLVELGPGRGTMMQDILRVFNKIGMNNAGLSVHLVEVSRELSKIQAKNLCTTVKETTGAHFMEGVTETGVPVYWYNSIESVPTCFTLILAHEFFDALPIHKFQKTDEGWREVLIDVNEAGNKLRYVISKAPTPASLYFTAGEEKRHHLEVSPQAGMIMQHIAQRLVNHGGFLLVADYGHTGEREDTFRAFRNHSQQDPLLEPGMSDLTADVDFSYLKKMVADKLLAFGPKSQHDFLKSLHIDIRLEVLLKKSKSKEEKEMLLSGYKMIMDRDKMGECFKFMSFFPSVVKELLEQFPVVGFEN
ncbi:protein arginine methyltransferase NDUFAF7, mitochondrial isoform X2 [Cimex lectularius]|nr:protein arginine methyltransferase NDUFAF7, mitochondrial isoform X2 [Cimex lectularius]